MIEILENHLNEVCYQDYVPDSNLILEIIEKAGMVPPQTLNPLTKKEKIYKEEDKDWKIVARIIDYHRGEVPYEFYVNEWEPEDEEI